jgi:hypothetical protein
MSRISSHNNDIDQIQDFLMSTENITKSEQISAMIGITIIIRNVILKIEKLEIEQIENDFHLTGKNLDEAIKKRKQY